MTTVLKLGGSVVTAKDEPETVDEGALAAAAASVAAATDDLVLVHGGGSFGHHHADRHGVTTTAGTDHAIAARAIHDAMKRLNDAVLDALATEGVEAVPVHPFSVGARDATGDLTLPTDSVETMLAEGFTPVLHGDVVAHEGNGATIVSGDELVVELATRLDAERVGLCSGVPGVLDESGAVVDRIERFADVEAALGGSDATDVTGGMAAKVRALLALDAPAVVFGAEDLPEFLAGDRPGTVVDGADDSTRS
jgi:isopentenyl phosphate kinase